MCPQITVTTPVSKLSMAIKVDFNLQVIYFKKWKNIKFLKITHFSKYNEFKKKLKLFLNMRKKTLK